MPTENETLPPADAGQVERRVRRFGRSVTASALRLLLLAPLVVLRGVLWSIAAAADKLAEGLDSAETALRPLCELPIHADMKRWIDEAKADEKRRLIEVLERALR